MADKEDKKKKKKGKKKKQNKKDKEQKEDFVKQLKIAYSTIENKKKFYATVLFPLIAIGIIVFLMPFIIEIAVGVPIGFNPITFIIGGTIPIFLGIFYPYVNWKNRESDINGKMHFFITHLRVLAISDLSLRDIIDMIGGKPVYGYLGEELKKISILSTQWHMPLSKTFRFVSARTPSKLLKDFLDRFSQSLDSGVEHRDFIEIEQDAVLEEYKTMYEASNENIVILNEVYVSMLIAIMFVMALGIVLPSIMGPENMNMYIYVSSFMLIVAEGLLLYLLKAMVPTDEFWHKTGEKGELELGLAKMLKISIIACIGIGVGLAAMKFYLEIPLPELLSIEVIITISLTPLIIVGAKTFIEEQKITRKETNFLGFLPALGSISSMRGGKINESVYYLSNKDYGVLTKHVRDLYRRLRTRINDDDAWEWFGVDTGSNYVQRAGEMFREATYAAANPRNVSKMIAENIRKIKNLRVKKITISNTSIALFGGITFGISFAIYVSLVIGRDMNEMLMQTANKATEAEGISDLGMQTILSTVPPKMYEDAFLIIFIVLIVHCFLLSYTLKVIRGSHTYIVFFYFVPFVWIVTITYLVVNTAIAGLLSA